MASVLKPLSHITSASPETLRIDLIIVVVGGRNLGTGRLWVWLLPTVKCPPPNPSSVHLHRLRRSFLHTFLHLLGSLFGINQAVSPFACGLS